MRYTWLPMMLLLPAIAIGTDREPPLEPFDPARRDEFGEEYDPVKYHACRARVQPNNMRCNVYKLRRKAQPEYWPYPDVPPPKWPEAPADSGYREGMTSKEYFEHLCKTEAGEFIYRTVDDVEGIYIIRPRVPHNNNDTLEDRYVFEDPYGHVITETWSIPLAFLPAGRYEFIEAPVLGVLDIDEQLTVPASSEAAQFVRYSGDVLGDLSAESSQLVAALASRYGVTWRGIKRERDRELGIAGGETIIVDLATNEILALKRGFVRSGFVKTNRTGIWWLSAVPCPGPPNLGSISAEFASRVVKPPTE